MPSPAPPVPSLPGPPPLRPARRAGGGVSNVCPTTGAPPPARSSLGLPRRGSPHPAIPVFSRAIVSRLAVALVALLAACDNPANPPPPVSALEVSVSGTLQRGATVSLSATRAGAAVPADLVAWSVAPSNAGEVLPGGQVRLLRAGTLTVTGTYSGSTGSKEVVVAELPGLVLAAAGTLRHGETVTLSATRGGQPVPVDQVAWTLLPADAGQVLPGGQLRLLRAGALQVSAAYDGSTGTLALAVAAPSALALSTSGVLERGKTVTVTATRDGQPVPADQVAWTLVPADAGEMTAGGQLRLLRSGALQLNAAYDGSTGTLQLNVAEPPPPSALALATSGRLERGRTVTLGATRDGQPVPADQVVWTVAPAGAAEVLPGGQLRLLAAGTLQLSASYDGSTGTLQLNVAEPAPLVLDVAGPLERGRTVQLSATRGGEAVPADQVAWTVAPAGAAEVLPGGQLRLLAAGSLTVTGAYDGSTGTLPLSVVEPPPLALAAAGRVERGLVVTLSATRSGQPVPADQVAWTVSPAGAAEVLGGGRIRLLATGPLQVQAAFENSTGTLPLAVAQPPVIVFDMSVAGNRDVYRAALDGGELTRITTEPAEDRDAAAAAGKVVFVSFRDGNSELYGAPLTGGAATRLTTTGRAESAPAVSPDGTRIAYAYDPTGVSRIWTASITGGGPAAFTGNLSLAGSPEASPSWAPTGNRLVFVATSDGSADLWDLAFGGQPNVLAGTDSAEVDPSWSPDGQHVAFASTRQGDAAIYLVRVSDKTVTRLSTRVGTEAEPTWTPDGRLVYVEFSAGGLTRLVWIDPADPQTVHVIPVQGGNPRRPSAAR